MINTAVDENFLSQLNHVYVGYSGGLDSTVLLHWLATKPALLKKLSVWHFHHGVSPHADAWEAHCRAFCQHLNLPLTVQKLHFSSLTNFEKIAREARHAVIQKMLNNDEAWVLGHHQDDQVETVLLQLCRGAGLNGLSAMSPSMPFGQGLMLRPFLNTPRAVLFDYAKAHDLTWIDDESNLDTTFSRNYIRQAILPRLKTRWPGVASNIARTAEHAQKAQTLLKSVACEDGVKATSPLCLLPLLTLSSARLENALRAWLEMQCVPLPDTATFNRLIPELVRARLDATPKVAWGGLCVQRYQNKLYLRQDVVPSLNAVEWTQLFSEGLSIPPDATVIVRSRKPGDCIIRHGQTQRLKKLFQAWHIPPWARASVPIIEVDGQVAAVVGYAISDLFFNTQ